jgi:HD-like signal output (HDOD) protein/CheY-like chemotaxis protein
MKRVLFVDDEPNVLDGLRRMLRDLRSEWEMGFASGGQEALQYLDSHPCDVVVTDMRMPIMDGAQLLDIVRVKCPSTVRIVLSGQSEQERVLRCLGPAHQFLSKPCDPALLKATLRRSCALRDRQSDPKLAAIVSQIGSLPSVPPLYSLLLSELEKSTPSIARIGELIAKDIGMTAKILQVTNSSFFGLPMRISDPTRAVMQLGLDRVRALVLVAGIFCQFEGRPDAKRDLDKLIRHCLSVATSAQNIARVESQDQQLIEDSFTAGMLHDIGILVLMVSLVDEYDRVVAAAREKQIPLWQAERETLGTTHSDVGAFLMSLWGLPNPIVEAIAWHHAPLECHGSTFSTLTAVHAANALLPIHSPLDPADTCEGIDQKYIELLGLSSRVPTWKQLVTTGAPGELVA